MEITSQGFICIYVNAALKPEVDENNILFSRSINSINKFNLGPKKKKQ
ncbi:hypothetical protein KDK_65200 [Dictyobacter kobayashii]|uniref:Uncharacterized protein n=1 Tax=Dictyobacter kobayashii TaxID=2014872 RepID=A0A402AUC0_9CHLR|nr:hypothetical protein KDK_65200 [Dictyobacter kobayashii]